MSKQANDAPTPGTLIKFVDDIGCLVDDPFIHESSSYDVVEDAPKGGVGLVLSSVIERRRECSLNVTSISKWMLLLVDGKLRWMYCSVGKRWSEHRLDD